MGRLDRCYNIADLRAVAKKRLPRGVFEYVDLGTEDLIALGNNRSAFADIKLLNKAAQQSHYRYLRCQVRGGDFRRTRCVAHGHCTHQYCRSYLV